MLPPGDAAGPHATPRRMLPRRPRREPPARPPYQQRHPTPGAPAALPHGSKHDARRDCASPPSASAGPKNGTAACVRLRAGTARRVAAAPVLAPLSPPSPSGPNLQEQASLLNVAPRAPHSNNDVRNLVHTKKKRCLGRGPRELGRRWPWASGRLCPAAARTRAAPCRSRAGVGCGRAAADCVLRVAAVGHCGSGRRRRWTRTFL